MSYLAKYVDEAGCKIVIVNGKAVWSISETVFKDALLSAMNDCIGYIAAYNNGRKDLGDFILSRIGVAEEYEELFYETQESKPSGEENIEDNERYVIMKEIIEKWKDDYRKINE